MRKLVVIAAVFAMIGAVSVETADARGCRGGRCCGGGCCYSSCCYSCCYSCCAPCYSCAPCYTCAAPDCATCAVAAPADTACATVVVNLPADAKLTINGKNTVSTSGKRTFRSPFLKKGRSYSYTLKATFDQGGKTQVVTKTVKFTPGQTVKVSLSPFSGSAVASR